MGIDIPGEAVVRILKALGLTEATAHDTGTVAFVPPSWRRDLAREIDLVEEVARVHGYDKIPEDVLVPLEVSKATLRDHLEAGGSQTGRIAVEDEHASRRRGARHHLERVQQRTVREITLGFDVGDFVDVARMTVGVDDGRHDGLAGEIDTRRTCGNRQFASPSNRGHASSLDDECRPFDRGPAVTEDQTRVLENGDSFSHGWLRALS